VFVLGIIIVGTYLVMQLRSRPEQEPFAITTEISPEDGMVRVLIPGGRFEMGSEEGYDNERPVHTTSVKDYWMDQTEITNAMYASCVEAGVCRLPRDTDFITNPALAQLPVVYVRWEDARTYCQWVGRELPSEAMWERAARGGLVGERYPWGDEEPVCTLGASNGAQIAGCGEGPVPVKSFESNGYGLFDMAGSVWEWVQDRYKPYPGGDPDADEAFGGEARVTRGGCFYDDGDDIGNAVRMGVFPEEAVDYIGFRCALIP
jgi:formylglycine-generating enzyme required for sulfatase activity